MLNSIKIIFQYLIPKRLLTKLAGYIANWNGKKITHIMIYLFIRIYKIDIKEARLSNIKDYKSFNKFFIRHIRLDMRPIEKNPLILVMPADGTISQIGKITKNYILQAKGYLYTLEELLVNNDSVNSFQNGSFVTIYLSPSNYHRIHMPCFGILREMIHVPGTLFSVSNLTATKIPNLFTKNERLICLFETNFGLIAQILIGAVIVGSISTTWSGIIKSKQNRTIQYWNYSKNEIKNKIILSKGQEMGYFQIGSTVINIFNKNILLNDRLYPNDIARVGKHLAHSILYNSYK